MYVLFARGSGATFSVPGQDTEANKFKDNVQAALGGVPSAWAELGNLYPDFDSQDNLDAGEYPAAGGPNVFAAAYAWIVQPGYNNSVRIGTDELVKHLNDRYSGDGPNNTGPCGNETVVIGGYSQGADVIGWALERTGGGDSWSLNQNTRNHIGAVALYGDPKYLGNFGQYFGCYQPPWAILNESCGQFPRTGILGARLPYVPNDIWSRVSSYCDASDGVCDGSVVMALAGSHTYIYKNQWIAASANRIAAIAISKRNQLNPYSAPVAGGQQPASGPPPQQVTSFNSGWVQPSDANHDGQPDLMVVPFIGTGSGTTEVHALEGHGFGSWLYNLPSGEASKTSRNAYHLFADYNGDRVTDLYEISMNPSGSTDVHVKAGPNYTVSLGDWATPIQGQSPYTAKAALYDKNGDGKADLYMFTPRPGEKVDVHILSGTSFSQSLGDFATPAGITTMNDYEMLVGDYNHDGTGDMYLVSLKGGGTYADVHVLSGAGGFQSWLGHWTTPFGACDVNHARVMLGDFNHDGQPDLYFMVYNNSAGKMDVHVMNGNGFNSYLGNWVTIAGAGSFSTTDLALAS